MTIKNLPINTGDFACMGYDSSPIKNSLCFCVSEKSIQSALQNPHITGIITTKHLAKKYDTSAVIFYISNTPKATFWQHWQRQTTPADYIAPNDIALDVTYEGVVHIAGTGVSIGKNVKIGAFTVIKSGTIIGDNVTIGANCALGGEALQTYTDTDTPIQLVKHRGTLQIKDNVTIMDGTIINRGVFAYHPTRIMQHCIIDNNVTIAHGCQIGVATQIAPAVQLCGRVCIGNNCFIGASSVVLNNISIGDNCYIGMGQHITNSLEKNIKKTKNRECFID